MTPTWTLAALPTRTTISKSSTSFFLDVEPMPSPRPRFRVIGKFASAYMPKDYKDHTAKLIEQLQQIACEPREGPLDVDLTVWVTRPKTSKLAFPKPDIDNYEKTVLDAITKAGNLWIDDTQVVRLTSLKLWAPEGGHAGYAVSIKPLTIL
jgi:Holliday junction resolvase RusA-like endonuclease